MDSPSSPAVDNGPHKGTLGEVWAFVNRDIRTFKWWRRNGACLETEGMQPPDLKTLTAPPNGSASEVVSEVDPRQLEALRLRREVLDWRDEFHFQVTETACQARKALAGQVEHELANMNFLRHRLFTKPASEVLKSHIESRVQSPMRSTTQREQAALRQRLVAWAPHRRETASIQVEWLKLEWDARLALKFTAKNRMLILTVLDELILGESGLADRHRQWATQYASQILEERDVRPDSV